jgi:hypothetical protein
VISEREGITIRTPAMRRAFQGCAVVAVLWPADGMIGKLFYGLISLVANTLAPGAAVGLLGGLVFGGRACIRHISLRPVFWRKRCFPLNHARFLDYAAERIFLRKVGGGYILIHRMLMEYFATLGGNRTSVLLRDMVNY